MEPPQNKEVECKRQCHQGNESLRLSLSTASPISYISSKREIECRLQDLVISWVTMRSCSYTELNALRLNRPDKTDQPKSARMSFRIIYVVQEHISAIRMVAASDTTH